MNETKPSILDPSFVYVPAEDTDIAVTFAREVAKLRDELVRPLARIVKRDLLDVYGQVERDDWMEPGGFK